MDSRQQRTGQRVWEAKSYHELPNRRIVGNPFVKHSFLSYGVIAYCSTTRRWLLVRRRLSPEFVNIVRGSFRIADLERHLEGATGEEIAALAALCTEEDFRYLFRETIVDLEAKVENGVQRYYDILPLLPSLLPRYTSNRKGAEWLWPKGRPLRRKVESELGGVNERSGEEKEATEVPFSVERRAPASLPERSDENREGKRREAGLVCANREFEEETGVTTEGQTLLSSTYISHISSGVSGRTYETRCWVYVFQEELPLPSVPAGGEVSARRWMKEAKAAKVLQGGKLLMLHEAKRLLYVHSYGPQLNILTTYRPVLSAIAEGEEERDRSEKGGEESG